MTTTGTRAAVPPYRLARAPRGPTEAPSLDSAQRRVVGHERGPLLVLAGPGTGKTTTIVESVVQRVAAGIDPERVLVLTFGRRAAAHLRDRITARLRRTTRSPLAFTFHGYAFALLRREAARTGVPAPRLLSGAEQDLEIRRLLRGEVQDGAGEWPGELRPALLTRGFARELRDLLARAEERGVTGDELEALGMARGRPDWVAAGRFRRRYEQRFAVDVTAPALDYAGLVQRAGDLLLDPAVGAAERAARPFVYVDEYQDIDPAQERLLQALAGGGGTLVAVGDPDQSIYGFRGADVSAVARFPGRFRTARGGPAPVVALRTSRRAGPDLLAASRRVAASLPAVPGTRSHRALQPAPGVAAGVVEVRLADSEAQEAALVADTLRRAHLLDGVPWGRMAVLVRSAVRSVPVLRRALVTAGVPVDVAGDEVPLVREFGVRPLLLLLRAALHPHALDEPTAVELLTGPLGMADQVLLRRLRRALRELEVLAGGRRSSGELLVEALRDPRDLIMVRDWVRRPVDRVAALLETVRRAVAAGGSAEDVLWAAWAASGLAERWAAVALHGSMRGAAADRALDAVLALFDAAARFVDRLPGAGPELFLDDVMSQELPSDTLAERPVVAAAVRLLTAHRAKGLEWDVVVVAGVQEGRWPDVRLRGSLLGVDELVESASAPERSVVRVAERLLAEERRLFYVAITRARDRLVVTAVGGPDSEDRPSRFLAELLPGFAEAPAAAPRPLALPTLVAELRSIVTDAAQPNPLRRSAAAQLAELARAGVAGADPGSWHALTALSDERPVAAPDAVVTVSPSQVEGFGRCGLRWLLERAVGAAPASAPAQAIGTVIHAVAALLADPAPADEKELVRRLDEVWPELDLGGGWYARAQRDAVVSQLHKLLDWHRASARTLLAVEQPFDVRSGRARVRGRVDRLERDPTGRGVVVDLKTGSSRPSADELARHPQLGVYQHAVRLGAFADRGVGEPGGAELIQLGKGGFSRRVREQPQPPLSDDPDPDWVGNLLAAVVDGMSAARFAATIGDHCHACPVRSCCPLQPEGAQVTP